MKRPTAAKLAMSRPIVCRRCKAPLEPTPSGFLTCPSGDRGLITAQVIVDADIADARSGRLVRGRSRRPLKA